MILHSIYSSYTGRPYEYHIIYEYKNPIDSCRSWDKFERYAFLMLVWATCDIYFKQKKLNGADLAYILLRAPSIDNKFGECYIFVERWGACRIDTGAILDGNIPQLRPECSSLWQRVVRLWLNRILKEFITRRRNLTLSYILCRYMYEYTYLIYILCFVFLRLQFWKCKQIL